MTAPAPNTILTGDCLSVMREFKTKGDVVAETLLQADCRGIAPQAQMNQIVCGDAISVMKGLAAGTFHVVVTSPPY